MYAKMINQIYVGNDYHKTLKNYSPVHHWVKVTTFHRLLLGSHCCELAYSGLSYLSAGN